VGIVRRSQWAGAEGIRFEFRHASRSPHRPKRMLRLSLAPSRRSRTVRNPTRGALLFLPAAGGFMSGSTWLLLFGSIGFRRHRSISTAMHGSRPTPRKPRTPLIRLFRLRHGIFPPFRCARRTSRQRLRSPPGAPRSFPGATKFGRGRFSEFSTFTECRFHCFGKARVHFLELLVSPGPVLILRIICEIGPFVE
jgi:hypothetical protein